MLTLKTRNFRPAHKNKVNYDPRAKNKSILVFTADLNPPQNQFSFESNTEVNLISIPTLKTR